MDFPEIVRGQGHWLFDKNDRAYFDLISGYGTVLLGHCDAVINQAVSHQLEIHGAVGRLPSAVKRLCYQEINSRLPSPLTLDMICSTAMQSNEYAAKLAATVTGKHGFIAFENSMHGKSALTSALSWHNAVMPFFGNEILPFPDMDNREMLLSGLEDLLKTGRFAACFIEPLRGSHDGSVADTSFCSAMVKLCQQYQALSVFDETLTGLYRTGKMFMTSDLPQQPDILIFAKSIANGLPASCVASSLDEPYHSRALRGSTFSDHPVVCAAIVATLAEIDKRFSQNYIGQVQRLFEEFQPLAASSGGKLQGKGLLWVLQCPEVSLAQRIAEGMQEKSVLLSLFGRSVRFLPKFNGDVVKLREVLCDVISLLQMESV